MSKERKVGYYRVAEGSSKFYDPSQPKDLVKRGLLFANQGIAKLVETEAVLQARAGGRLISCTERDFNEQSEPKEEPKEEPKTESKAGKAGKKEEAPKE